MKTYLKIFKNTKPWMYLPFAVFKLAKWVFEPDNFVERGWRYCFLEFNLMLITMPVILILLAVLNSYLHFIS